MTPRAAAAARATAPPNRETFYRDVLERLGEARVPCLVGGAYGLASVTGIAPRTKDLDLFVRRVDCHSALEVLAAADYETAVPYPHWLAKVRAADEVIDLIFNSGNGQSPVDDEWFAHALHAEVCGVPVRVCPIEEMLWTKAFVMERERYDGADVVHLLHAAAECIDWQRVLNRFGDHWPVLLSHLLLFAYVYPGEADRVPAAILTRLLDRARRGAGSPLSNAKLCRGGMLSRAQYVVDLADWGYDDARLAPRGAMTAEELAQWTEAAPEVPRAAPDTHIALERKPEVTEREPL